MGAFLLAVSFLTVIPVGRVKAETRIGRSVGYFPVVGLMIGVALAGADALFSRMLPAPIENAMLVLAMVVLTNGLHLDGLADVADGLGGGRNATEALEIMKDSGIGAFGAAAIFFDLLLKYLLLSYLPSGIKPASLAVFPMLSRWGMSVSVSTQRSPRGESGLAGWLSGRATAADLALSTAIAVIACALALRIYAVAAFAAAALATLFISLYFRYRLGGMTGDCHGALNEAVEIAVLLTIMATAR